MNDIDVATMTDKGISGISADRFRAIEMQSEINQMQIRQLLESEKENKNNKNHIEQLQKELASIKAAYRWVLMALAGVLINTFMEFVLNGGLNAGT